MRLRNSPRPWQREALLAWRANGSSGIVEAVTGTGKTHVGLAAIADELDAGGSAVVVVPTIELLQQWQTAIERELPDVTVGLLGGGCVPSEHDDVVVAVVNSLRVPDARRVAQGRDLLVADECHGYGAPQNQLVLRSGHTRRLGLTATLERSDDGIEQFLLPYFGDVVYTFDYADAVRHGNVISPFHIAFVEVDLDDEEQRSYERCERNMRKAFVTLLSFFEQTPSVEEISALAKSEDWTRTEVRASKQWLKARTDRAETVAQCRAKDRLLDRLRPVLQGHRSIVFVDKKTTARTVATRLHHRDTPAGYLHSGLDRRSRRDVLDRFRAGRISTVVAPKVLDEGVDVPDADLAVILSASSTRRQMIQRMGRVLRIKTDGRHANFIIVYARGTYEAPGRSGRHEAFLDLVTEVANSQYCFDAEHLDDLTEFLSDVTDSRAATTATELAASERSIDPRVADEPASAAPRDAGAHRAGTDRPSFLGRVGRIGQRWSGPRHAVADRQPADRTPTSPRLRVSTQFVPSEICNGCGAPVSANAHCRCS